MLPPMLTARTGQASLAINPWIFAVAAINAILAVGIGILIAPIVWSVDGDRNLAAAHALVAGTFGQDHGYLYTPLAAALTLPAALALPYGVAVVGWLVARAGVLLEGVRREVGDLSTVDRVLVAVAAIGFIPTLHDLLLGNVSILIAAAVAIVAWSADGYLAGLPLGLVLATAPKPALIPILIWMVIFRRRALVSAIGSAVALSGVGLLVLGIPTYSAWFQVLLHPYYLGTNQTGNLALGAMLPPILAWPLIALTIVATIVALRRGETPGLHRLPVRRPARRAVHDGLWRGPAPACCQAARSRRACAILHPGRDRFDRGHRLPAVVGRGDPRHDPRDSSDVLEPPAARSRHVSRRWPVLAIFILSGAAGLIYEVVWARQLVLVFGNTTQAVSAILTGFFGGIAIGSVIGGRIADRARRALRMYGLLELILVVIVLLTPVTFRLLHDVYRGAFDSLEASPTILALIRFGLSLLALGPATILMGATLPTLTRHLSRDPANLSTSFGRLYAANTVGAIVGTIAAGFVLIELLGLTGTLLVGAACSAIAGPQRPLPRLAAGRAAPECRAGRPRPRSKPAASAPAARSAGPDRRLHLRADLARLPGPVDPPARLGNGRLDLRLHHDPGDLPDRAGARRGRLQRLPRLGSGRSTCSPLGQVVIALLVLVGMVNDDRARHTPAILSLTTDFGSLFTDFAAAGRARRAAGDVRDGPDLPRVVGADRRPGRPCRQQRRTAPVGEHPGRDHRHVPHPVRRHPAGRLTGRPRPDRPPQCRHRALPSHLPVGSRTACRGWSPAALGAIVAAALVVALAVGGLFVDPNVARILGAQRHRSTASAEDDIASVQAGLALRAIQQLWVTGTSMTILTVDVKLMPILPLILRPSSTTNLTVAFGMGSAWRAALNAGLTSTVVELVPSVPHMFGVFYPDAPEVLANPKGNIVIADGRNHVELTNDHYDMIVTDPPPPIETAGVSVISSLEYYQAAKARLNPGGVMMQWIPYGQTIDEFKAHVRTYASVFPHVIIAFGAGGFGLYMLGSDQPISLDPAAIQAVLSRPGIVQDLSSAADSPVHDLAGWAAEIPQLVWIQGDQVPKFAGSGPLITDDHPLPEYFLLRHLFGPPSPLVSPGLLRSMTPAP